MFYEHGFLRKRNSRLLTVLLDSPFLQQYCRKLIFALDNHSALYHVTKNVSLIKHLRPGT